MHQKNNVLQKHVTRLGQFNVQHPQYYIRSTLLNPHHLPVSLLNLLSHISASLTPALCLLQPIFTHLALIAFTIHGPSIFPSLLTFNV